MPKYDAFNKLVELSGMSPAEVGTRIKKLSGGKTISKLRRPYMNRKQRRIAESKERHG